MRDCLFTMYKSSVNIEHAEYINKLRIPVVKNQGASVIAQKFRFVFTTAASASATATIVGDGHFTTNGQDDLGKTVNAVDKVIEALFTNGDYDIYIPISGLEKFETGTLSTGVISGLDYIDYKRFVRNNAETLQQFFLPSEDALDGSDYALVCQKNATKIIIINNSLCSLNELMGRIAPCLNESAINANTGFRFVYKTGSSDHYGTINPGAYRFIKEMSKTQYKVYSMSNSLLYTATLVNGVWQYT